MKAYKSIDEEKKLSAIWKNKEDLISFYDLDESQIEEIEVAENHFSHPFYNFLNIKDEVIENYI